MVRTLREIKGEIYLLTDWPDVLAEGGGEHHHLLLVRSGSEDLLDISPHVQLLQHLVALVQDEMLQILQWELLALDEGENPAGSSHNNMRTVALQNLLVFRDRHSSEKHPNLEQCRFSQIPHQHNIIFLP